MGLNSSCKKVEKVLVFDMDGTIANLYRVNGWLKMLMAENAEPYAIAEPMVDLNSLYTELYRLKENGWKIVIASWGSKVYSKKFQRATRAAKKIWLDNHNFPYDHLRVLRYGKNKYNVVKNYGNYFILIDDEEKPRKDFIQNGQYALDPSVIDMIDWLRYLA